MQQVSKIVTSWRTKREKKMELVFVQAVEKRILLLLQKLKNSLSAIFHLMILSITKFEKSLTKKVCLLNPKESIAIESQREQKIHNTKQLNHKDYFGHMPTDRFTIGLSKNFTKQSMYFILF